MSLPFFGYTTDLPGFLPCPFCSRTVQEIFKVRQRWGRSHDYIAFRIHCHCGLDFNTSLYCYGKIDKHYMDERKMRKKLLKPVQEAWNERWRG